MLLDQFLVLVVGARVAGYKDPASGKVFGGFYNRGVMKNGSYSPGRYTCRVITNMPDRVGTNGEVIEGKRVGMGLTIFSNHDQRSGQAEIAAKYLSPGKAVSFLATIDAYADATHKDGQGNVITFNGQPLTYERHSLILVPGTLKLGRDSQNQIDREIQEHATNGGQVTFFSRPAQWNVPGSADEAAWKNICLPARKQAVCRIDSKTFGYALVNAIPNGATFAALKDVNYNATTGTTTGTTGTAAAGGNQQQLLSMMAQLLQANQNGGAQSGNVDINALMAQLNGGGASSASAGSSAAAGTEVIDGL